MAQFNREIFERAFDGHVGSARSMCACGRIFYNPDGGWDWNPGELEDLGKNLNAVALDYSVSYVEFEGTVYVADCGCWVPRAEKIWGFLISHADQIIELLKAEKARRIADADNFCNEIEG